MKGRGVALAFYTIRGKDDEGFGKKVYKKNNFLCDYCDSFVD